MTNEKLYVLVDPRLDLNQLTKSLIESGKKQFGMTSGGSYIGTFNSVEQANGEKKELIREVQLSLKNKSNIESYEEFWRNKLNQYRKLKVAEISLQCSAQFRE